MSMFYSSYFDASGKSDSHPFVTMAGAGSTIEKWKGFEREWSAILTREKVTEFHATDFASSLAEFKNWKGDKGRRSHFLRDLVAVARKYTNKLFTVTVEMAEWSAVNSLYMLEEHFYSPYALAGLASADQTIFWAKNRKKADSHIQIFFEAGDEGWDGLSNLCQKYLKVEPVRLPKKKAYAFQLGDMLAWKTRITATNTILKLRAIESYIPEYEREFERMRKELRNLDKLMCRPANEGIFSRKSLIRNCERYKVPKR